MLGMFSRNPKLCYLFRGFPALPVLRAGLHDMEWDIEWRVLSMRRGHFRLCALRRSHGTMFEMEII